MFALNLMVVASEVGWLDQSTLGWIVIAIAWSIIGALWLAGSFLSAQRALQSSGLVSDRECPDARNT